METSTQSTLLTFTHGTGLSVYQNLLLPAIARARSEIILATCFWASSQTLDDLILTLRQLSERTITASNPKVSVYICFSSRSASQKLFHTSSPSGHTYSPEKWPQKLGLPPAEELPGLNIAVKSLFFRPFSVLHSKYLIVDREIVFFPSCNVSWENWYECAVGFEGPIVQHVFQFWRQVWMLNSQPVLPEATLKDNSRLTVIPQLGPALQLDHLVKSTLLPHPHDASLTQAFWPLPTALAPLPSTPLNLTLLRIISMAQNEVVLLTPNFTSEPAFTAISCALLRGVNVHLITDRHMMVPEQLVTAGVLTEQFIDRLIKNYRTKFVGSRMKKNFAKLQALIGPLPFPPVERRARLKISYFHTSPKQGLDPPSMGNTSSGRDYIGVAAEAGKSHVKLTMVDRCIMVFGSGNMDRASWRTSQELAVMIEDRDSSPSSVNVIDKIWVELQKGLAGCLSTYFEG